MMVLIISCLVGRQGSNSQGAACFSPWVGVVAASGFGVLGVRQGGLYPPRAVGGL
jgi:hypothetical protein